MRPFAPARFEWPVMIAGAVVAVALLAMVILNLTACSGPIRCPDVMTLGVS